MKKSKNISTKIPYVGKPTSYIWKNRDKDKKNGGSKPPPCDCGCGLENGGSKPPPYDCGCGLKNGGSKPPPYEDPRQVQEPVGGLIFMQKRILIGCNIIFSAGKRGRVFSANGIAGWCTTYRGIRRPKTRTPNRRVPRSGRCV